MDKKEEQFIKEELLVRDYLAADRTMLSIDRTFLAYVRTALTLFVAGVSLIKFFDSYLIQIIGWSLIPFGILTFVVGLQRCLDMNIFIRSLSKKHGYRIESAPNSDVFASFNLTAILKKIFTNIYHSFIPATHQNEPKT